MFKDDKFQHERMRFPTTFVKLLLATAMGLSMASGLAQQTALAPGLKIKPARISAAAQTSMALASTLAGDRIVAVGERGTVLLSDDSGKTFRQAKSVPISATLTSVHFVDAKNGWCAGHWGAILKTSDAGETWKLQRTDTKVDQPLFSIYFQDEKTGWAAGLWSLLLKTTDGGATWQTLTLPVPPGESKADRNLFDIFPDQQGGLAITAERGAIVRSADGGESWTYTDTGYKGSLWSGQVLRDGTWLVGGLRGTVLRSADRGKTWQPAQTGTKSSITGTLQSEGGVVIAYGLDGVVMSSVDSGATFSVTQRRDQATITTAVIAANGKLVTFSEAGLLTEETGADSQKN